MGFGFRKSKKLGPFRLTLTHRGVSGSVGAGPVRVSRSSTGRRTKSVRIGGARAGAESPPGRQPQLPTYRNAWFGTEGD